MLSFVLLLAVACPPQDEVCKAAQGFSRQTAKCFPLITQTDNSYTPWVPLAEARDQVLDLTGQVRRMEETAAEIFKLRHRRVAQCMEKELRKWLAIAEEFDKHRTRRWPVIP